jgi:hypothetical protein
MPYPRSLAYLSLLLILTFSPPSFAQTPFKVIPGTAISAEGETVSVLLIQAGDDHFSLRIPKDYGTQVKPESHSITFTAESGVSLITVQVSPKYAGALPKTEELSDVVTKDHPGATLVQSAPCVSDYGPGLCFDLSIPERNNLTLRLSDAYIPYPAGSFEFIFSCNGADYDKNRLDFIWLLNSFRSQPKPAKTEP